MRLVDPKEAYPDEPKDLYDHFSRSLDRMHNLARSTLMHIAAGLPDGDGKEQEHRWITQSSLDACMEFMEPGSSVSVIRYFASESDAPALHCPCDEHYDTGVLTVILLSEVPGLQVENRHKPDWVTQEWIPVEEVGRPGDFVVIMGRKIEILCERDCGLTPTFHRVQLRQDVMRHSILFFYDMQTGPEK